VQVRNDFLRDQKADTFHHLGLSTKMKHFNETFSDLKYVCFSGSQGRVYNMADRLLNELNISKPIGFQLANICKNTDRYVMYKVGPVLCVNHGIGISSSSVVLNEIIKVLYYSNATDVSMFRIGTSGGIGISAGTVVITSVAVDGLLRPFLEVPILGELVKIPSSLSVSQNEKLLKCGDPSDDFQIIPGKTMCSWDFYEGQARLDGARCEFNMEKKQAFLKKAYDDGVRNVEMESLTFATMCCQAGISASVICVTLLNRFETDQITVSEDCLREWAHRPMTVVIRHIRSQLCKRE
ncbi:hypothetical protein HELRODRAFT_88580, partial [Helobdella robusta]|uniref:Nucleoside phosphorylase domain-containing protein n=1 Tax=Helobdella robusta TaxID=6412 RepID=T1G740_HELRO